MLRSSKLSPRILVPYYHNLYAVSARDTNATATTAFLCPVANLEFIVTSCKLSSERKDTLTYGFASGGPGGIPQQSGTYSPGNFVCNLQFGNSNGVISFGAGTIVKGRLAGVRHAVFS